MADPTKTHEARKWQHTCPFVSGRFDPLGRYVFAGAQDNSVQRYSLEKEETTPLAGHDSWVRAIAFSPDGAATYTGGYDGALVWWETAAEKPQPLRSVPAHNGWLRAIAVSPDGATLATCGNDHLIKLWNAASGALIRELAGHERHVYNVVFHPDGQQLASMDLVGAVKHWSAADGKMQREWKAEDIHKYDPSFLADIGGARCMAFNSDGKQLAIGSITNVTNAFAGVGNPAVVLFDWEKGEKLQLHKPAENLNGVAWGVAFHPEGFLICAAGGGSGGFLFFYKPDKPEEFFKLALPSPARDLSLHKDNLRLAVPHFDNSLRLWAMEEKKG